MRNTIQGVHMPQMSGALSQTIQTPTGKKNPKTVSSSLSIWYKNCWKEWEDRGQGGVSCFLGFYTSLGFLLKPLLGTRYLSSSICLCIPTVVVSIQTEHKSPKTPDYSLTAKPTQTGRNQVEFQQRRFSLSFYHNYLLMGPNRENIISRSSPVVTGFSLQTNSTFSGGLMSASGKSPTWDTGKRHSSFLPKALYRSTAHWKHIFCVISHSHHKIKT